MSWILNFISGVMLAFLSATTFANSENIITSRLGKSLRGTFQAEDNVKNFGSTIFSLGILRTGQGKSNYKTGLGGYFDMMPSSYTTNGVQKNGIGFSVNLAANWFVLGDDWDRDMSLGLSIYNRLNLLSFSRGTVNDQSITHSGSSVLTGNFGFELGAGMMRKFRIFGSRGRLGFSATLKKLYYNSIEEKISNSKNQNNSENSRVSYSVELISLFLNLDYTL